ncbi:MAG: putative rane protein of unknown function [Sphingomonas bacterium]|uniref:DUF805 domain-containing protein n=1 Tax=Sphingomonas bacterium TaxID=1895847 RepID=UPI0026383C18|nr:DUF805 domain-containing protein [Sphingomonas bacterium]MDB5704780.1 putative rane protein of unknown function [Sphingomonas bacterium]
MLHNVLGFGGRMGRLEYFLCSLVFAMLMLLVIVALFFGFAPHFGAAGAGGRSSVPPGFILTLLVVVLPVYLWFSLAFQAKRFRDMGWNPLYVLPGWIAAQVIDRFVAFAIPSLALAPGTGTLVGTLLSLFMGCALLFWPSAPSTAGDWDNGNYHWGSPDPDADPGPGRARETTRAARTAAAWSPPPAAAPSGFGRRGL